jgi:ABC-2 type transport system ATP-binding protein
MTQRLALARVLLHEPQVLLLDEPASGLDPRARIEMRGLLKELRKMGKTILVSSHILPELADICNKIGIIERGKLLFDGDVNTAIRQVQQKVVFDVKVAPEQLSQAEDLLRKHADVETVERKTPEEFEELRKRDANEFLRVTLKDGVFEGGFIAETLVKNGLTLKMLREEEIDLEDVFMGITKGITN